MRARSLLLAMLTLVGVILPPASAGNNDPVSVEADISGTDRTCDSIVAETPCLIQWDENGTTTPTDDTIESFVFVEDVRATIHSPTSENPPERVVVDPRNLTLRHSAYQYANRTWMNLNDTRPESARPYVSFESRSLRKCGEDGQWVDGGKWSIALDVDPPGHPYKCDPIALITWCWSICFIDNQTYGRLSEDEIQPFPEGVFVGSEADRGLDSDTQVHDKFTEAENCGYMPLVPCETATVQPWLRAAAGEYAEATPNLKAGFQYNQTAVVVKPAHPDSVRVESNDVPISHPAHTPYSGMRAPRPVSPKNGLQPTDDEPKWGASGTPGLAIDSGRPIPPRIAGAEGPTDAFDHIRVVWIAAAVVATTLLGLLWALYSRLSKRAILYQDTRHRISEALRARPGLRAAEIASALGLGHNTVKYHLQMLEAAGLVRLGEGKRPRYFLASVSSADAKRLAALAQPTLQTIYATLCERIEADHSTLAAVVKVSVQSIGRAVAKLEAAGLVTQTKEGKRVVVRLSQSSSAL